jgi:hypothetical protein
MERKGTFHKKSHLENRSLCSKIYIFIYAAYNTDICSERPIGIKRRGIQDSRAGYMIRILNKIREYINLEENWKK